MPQTLQSILTQYDERVEVVVCDNGSQDETSQVMASFVQRYPRVRYHALEKNMGPDLCFLKVVDLAVGKYCWLLSDDDILEPGSLALILSLLDKDPNLSGITVNRYAYDSSMQKKWIEPALISTEDSLLFTEAKACLSELFLFFGFLSAQIVRKERWQQVVASEDIRPYFTAYVLVYIIGRMIQNDPRWLYVADRCIGWRSDNDSFAKELGRFRRFELDLIGYTKIVSGLCGQDRSLYRKIMGKICRVHLFAHLNHLKATPAIPSVSWRFLSLSWAYLKKVPAFWYKILPVIFIPEHLWRGIRYMVMRYKGSMKSQLH